MKITKKLWIEYSKYVDRINKNKEKSSCSIIDDCRRKREEERIIELFNYKLKYNASSWFSNLSMVDPNMHRAISDSASMQSTWPGTFLSTTKKDMDKTVEGFYEWYSFKKK